MFKAALQNSEARLACNKQQSDVLLINEDWLTE